jgi:hypothetical protein
MSKYFFYNIAHIRHIKINLDRLSIQQLAEDCNLFEDQIETIISKHCKTAPSLHEKRFKKFVADTEAASKKSNLIERKKVPAFLAKSKSNQEPIHIPIVRPPAQYTNTNWDQYQEQILNN